MITKKLVPGANVIYIGLYGPRQATVVSVNGDDVTLRDDNGGVFTVPRTCRYLCPRRAYRRLHAFKWEVLPFQWT